METIERYVEALASDAPVPGGGSAATVVAAMGAALVGMVARICGNNPKYAEHAAHCAQLVERSDALRTSLLAARAHDERAFGAVVEAQALPKGTDAEKTSRTRALQQALSGAAQAPLEAAALACDVILAAAELPAIGNRNLASDAGCAAEFGAAALTSSAYNVRVNHRFMHDAAAIATQESQLAAYENEGRLALDRTRVAIAHQLARPV